jgi:hypothetical protein
MIARVKFLLVVVCVMTFSFASAAQTTERRQASPSPNAAVDPVANEIGLLRESLQTLTARLGQISERLLAPASKQGEPTDARSRISLSLELLGRAEQRADSMRKQVLELTEKETAYKSRLVQLDEDMRPDSIERATSLVGTTRTPELRETRRRVLDNDRRGYETLLRITSEARAQLEDDLKRADMMVSRLRQRVLPLIEREIERINPNQ